MDLRTLPRQNLPHRLYRSLSRPSLHSRSRPLRCSLTRRHRSTTTTTTTTRSPTKQDFEKMPRNPLDPITIHRIEAARRAYYTRGMYRAAAGMITCIGITALIVATVDIEKMKEKNDSPNNNPLNDTQSGVPVVVKAASNNTLLPSTTTTTLVRDSIEVVQTGTSTIPHFPKTIILEETSPQTQNSTSTATATLPAGSKPRETGTEYTLLGLGIRTVSFLGIQVYVVGLYLAKDDISGLQASLTHEINPIATTLVADEKQKLKEMLLDPHKGEEVWNEILRKSRKEGGGEGIRSVLRIVPTRNTDWLHLRDGWMRAITTRTQEAASKASKASSVQASRGATAGVVSAIGSGTKVVDEGGDDFQDEEFGRSIVQFKDLFKNAPRSKNPKGEPILLVRDEKGGMDVLTTPSSKPTNDQAPSNNLGVKAARVNEGPGTDGVAKEKKEEMIKIGRIQDERISRLICLQYLAGKKVASEGLRTNVVEGVMELVERPVGTVVVSI